MKIRIRDPTALIPTADGVTLPAPVSVSVPESVHVLAPSVRTNCAAHSASIAENSEFSCASPNSNTQNCDCVASTQQLYQVHHDGQNHSVHSSSAASTSTWLPSSSFCFDLNVSPTLLVTNVKLAIVKRCKNTFPVHSVQLYFSGVQMKNHRSLYDYCVAENSVILMVLQHGHGRNNGNGSSANSAHVPGSKHTTDTEKPVQPIGPIPPTSALRRLISSVCHSLRLGFVPKLSEEGTGGSYMLRNGHKKTVAVFKARDEEPFAPNNQRGYVGKYMDPGLRKGIKSGEGYSREIAAFLLDHQAFSAVPGTCAVSVPKRFFPKQKTQFIFTAPSLTTTLSAPSQPLAPPLSSSAASSSSSSSSATSRLSDGAMKVGSFQSFVDFDDFASDVSSHLFPVQQCQKLALLDIRILNVDRNDANILVKKKWLDDEKNVSQKAVLSESRPSRPSTPLLAALPTLPLQSLIQSALDKDNENVHQHQHHHQQQHPAPVISPTSRPIRNGSGGIGTGGGNGHTYANGHSHGHAANLPSPSHSAFDSPILTAGPLLRRVSSLKKFYEEKELLSSFCMLPSPLHNPANLTTNTNTHPAGHAHANGTINANATSALCALPPPLIGNKSRSNSTKKSANESENDSDDDDDTHQQQSMQHQQRNQQPVGKGSIFSASSIPFAGSAMSAPAAIHRNSHSSNSPSSSPSPSPPLNSAQTYLELIPIDHSYSLPDRLEICDFEVAWTSWEQIHTANTHAIRHYIRKLDVEKDIALLSSVLNIRHECLALMRVSYLLLKKCEEHSLTLGQAAALLFRNDMDTPSKVESLCWQAAKQTIQHLNQQKLSQQLSHKLSVLAPLTPLALHHSWSAIFGGSAITPMPITQSITAKGDGHSNGNTNHSKANIAHSSHQQQLLSRAFTEPRHSPIAERDETILPTDSRQESQQLQQHYFTFAPQAPARMENLSRADSHTNQIQHSHSDNSVNANATLTGDSTATGPCSHQCRHSACGHQQSSACSCNCSSCSTNNLSASSVTLECLDESSGPFSFVGLPYFTVKKSVLLYSPAMDSFVKFFEEALETHIKTMSNTHTLDI